MILYRIFLGVYLLGIRLSAIFGNDKARRWLDGRKGLRQKLQALPPGEERVWVHCSSLGEFEQGRPVIEKLKMDNEKCKIVLTFFSPSGYEVRKNYPGADYVFYMPLDGMYRSKMFIESVKPSSAFFIKYEYWYFFLHELNRQTIPAYMISSVFRPHQVFFKWYGGFFRKMLSFITRFYVQDEQSGELLSSIGFNNFIVSGDTRFDRVLQVASESKDIREVNDFVQHSPVLVAGSTWPEDEKLLVQFHHSFPGWKLIIAPHEVSAERTRELCSRFSNAVSLTDLAKFPGSKVLIIDRIGLLSSLYRYGKFAYVGGGFGKGIHNILEAAVYGAPVFFGPNYRKFNEASELISRGGAFSVTSIAELKNTFELLSTEKQQYEKVSAASADYVKSRAGATEKILF